MFERPKVELSPFGISTPPPCKGAIKPPENIYDDPDLIAAQIGLTVIDPGPTPPPEYKAADLFRDTWRAAGKVDIEKYHHLYDTVRFKGAKAGIQEVAVGTVRVGLENVITYTNSDDTRDAASWGLDLINELVDGWGVEKVKSTYPKFARDVLRNYRFPPGEIDYPKEYNDVITLLNRVDKEWATTIINGEEVSKLSNFEYASYDAIKLFTIYPPDKPLKQHELVFC